MTTKMATEANSAIDDQEVIRRVLSGDTPMFEVLMRRYNQLVYRAARAVLGNDGEAEDVMQEAYVRAYQHLHQFAGRAKFSTWISRIAINEALSRLREQSFYQEPRLTPEKSQEHRMDRFPSLAQSPEQQASALELRSLLERAIETLPKIYRAVFVLRDVEEMSTEDTAITLDITEETVKTRLHRARALLQKELYRNVGASNREVFSFYAVRCDRVVAGVFERLPKLGDVCTIHE